ncbi:MAG: ribose-phosphate pyrophosphokinase [Bdellovibrionales bacterium]|nr:ribose-phosphate pyrophosphokinase [Bdellovibrionales bacterium]
MSKNELKIFTGNSNRALADSICDYLQIPLGKAKVKSFSDGETWVEVGENVRGQDVFVIQSTSNPANDNLMELLVIIDALKRASADRITAVMPYYGYARQDRKVAPRTPISAKLVADLLESAGASRIVSMDLHAAQIQGFFNIPFDHLYGSPVLIDAVRNLSIRDDEEIVIVSPDAGGVERARAYAKILNCSLAIIDKRRVQANISQVMNVIGEVAGKVAVIVDDMIDTAGTMTQAVPVLLDQGAKKVYCAATHPVLSGPAIERINQSRLEAIFVTDTIPLEGKAQESKKIKVCSVANILGEAIRRVHNRDSVSSLFK